MERTPLRYDVNMAAREVAVSALMRSLTSFGGSCGKAIVGWRRISILEQRRGAMGSHGELVVNMC